VKERIILTGYVADQDMAAYSALVFVYPSFMRALATTLAMQCRRLPLIHFFPEVVGDAELCLTL